MTTKFRIELEFNNLAFKGRGNLAGSAPRKILKGNGETNDKLNQHARRLHWDLIPGHIGGRRVLSPLRLLCFPDYVIFLYYQRSVQMKTKQY